MTVLASRWLAISIHAKSGCCTTSWRDRKSTRLNSSHSQISYAVFCLKKKKNHIPPTYDPTLSFRQANRSIPTRVRAQNNHTIYQHRPRYLDTTHTSQRNTSTLIALHS